MATSHISTSTTLYVIHLRRQVSSVCLMLSVAMALCAALRLFNWPVMATPVAGAILFLLHGMLDPSRQGFLHHRRLRLPGVGLTLLATAVIGMITPGGATPPLLFALAIAVRHHRGGAALHLAASRELEDMKRKIIALESRRLMELNVGAAQAAPIPLSDKLRKAV